MLLILLLLAYCAALSDFDHCPSPPWDRVTSLEIDEGSEREELVINTPHSYFQGNGKLLVFNTSIAYVVGRWHHVMALQGYCIFCGHFEEMTVIDPAGIQLPYGKTDDPLW